MAVASEQMGCELFALTRHSRPMQSWLKENPLLQPTIRTLTTLVCSWTIAAGLGACAHAAAPVMSVPAATASVQGPFSEAPLPHYLVRHAAAPIAIDGHLDEFDWAAAPQIDGLTRILNLYGQVLNATRAKMIWDEDALYIAFASHDQDMWALFTEEDDPMWSEEVVEAFIDPDGDGLNYLEVEVNPLNAVVDLHISSVSPEWVSDKDWDITGLQTAVVAHGTVNDSTDIDTGWTVEMAIPWTAFVPTITGGGKPQVGDRWRLNLYRIERGAGSGVAAQLRALREQAAPLQEQLAALGQGQSEAHARLEARLAEIQAEAQPLNELYGDRTEYTAWSPTFQRGFHHPSRFGIIEFAP